MSQHALFHYSITIKTNDEAVLHCLRSLSQYAQQTGNKRIPWGGTKRGDWERDGYSVTFHFSSLEYRNIFLNEVSRLLSNDLWKKIGENDNDPAVPQS